MDSKLLHRAFTLAAVFLVAMAASAASIRELIPSEQYPGYPIWVPAGLAVDEEGKVRWELIPEDYQGHLRGREEKLASLSAREKSSRECAMEISSDFGAANPTPNSNLEELTQYASAVYRGRVVDVAPGLYNGVLGSLVSVEVRASLKVAEDAEVETLNLFILKGALSTEGATLCETRSKRLPSVESELVIFSKASAPGAGHVALSPRDEEFFYQLSDGSVSLPERMREQLGPDYQLGFEEFMVRVQAAVAKEAEE